MKTRSIAVACVAAVLALAACSSDSKTAATTMAPTTMAPSTMPAAAGDIVAVAAGNPDFSTLVAAVKAAGLVETLQGPGPFTVFAPTNEAFAKLPAGLLDKLLLPANKDVLTKILTYHVVAGNVMAADVKPGGVKSVEGSPITVAVTGTTVTLNGSTKVTATDVAASNGVIHVIDSVLVPADVDLTKL
jgi:uncharacterized surface protein with fasciclin (FAS1) repeats